MSEPMICWDLGATIRDDEGRELANTWPVRDRQTGAYLGAIRRGVGDVYAGYSIKRAGTKVWTFPRKDFASALAALALPQESLSDAQQAKRDRFEEVMDF